MSPAARCARAPLPGRPGPAAPCLRRADELLKGSGALVCSLVQAVVIFVPFKLLKVVHKIQSRLVREVRRRTTEHCCLRRGRERFRVTRGLRPDRDARRARVAAEACRDSRHLFDVPQQRTWRLPDGLSGERKLVGQS